MGIYLKMHFIIEISDRNMDIIDIYHSNMDKTFIYIIKLMINYKSGYNDISMY